MLYVRMWTNSPYFRVRYSYGFGRIARVCVYAIRCGCGRIARVYVYAIRADADNSPCLRVRYSCGSRRIARILVCATREYADE